jgi:phage tail-like protein
MPVTMDMRGYVAGKYGIELGGILAGWVQSVEGGHATSDVVNEKVGPDHIIHKHIAGVKYEDITVTCGTGMTKDFYNWIKASFDHNYLRKDGAIITANYNYKEYSRMTFYHALITEIGFPALDAASKDAAKMTIKIAPEYTRITQPGGGKTLGAVKAQVQKKWLPANFRLKVTGLDCTRVNKIDAIVVKQKIIDNAVGELRDYEREPAHLEIPNLVVTLAESHADDWYKWHEDFVIKGNNGDDMEKGGTLEFLTPDLKEALFTITLKHMGIFKLAPEKVEAGTEAIRRVKAELYVEDMAFEYHAGWA